MEIFEKKFSKAIELVQNSGMSSPNKPVIPHALRVGELLFEKGFSGDIINAGLLHDILEWSDTSEEKIRYEFGEYVLDLIKANTKDRRIEDKTARRQAQIDACLKIGDDALAIKIADNIDSFRYYSEIEKGRELQRCRDWNDLLEKNISSQLRHIFADELAYMVR